MSASICIPTSRSATAEGHNQSPKGAVGSSSASSYSSSPQNMPQKQKVLHHRRPSLLSSAISKEECAVINLSSDPDAPARLITYQVSGQGFVWNPEIFLPSYVDYDYTPLENRREPVHDILLSDEEIRNMLPQ